MVKPALYLPEKGDFVFMQFTPQSGREHAGHHPGIVRSPKKFNISVGLAFVAAITSRVRGGSFEVQVPAKGRITGVVLPQQTKSVDWTSRQITFHGRAPQHIVDSVLERVRLILEL